VKFQILAAAALAATLFAQTPGAPGQGMRQPRIDELKSYLSLSDSQVQQLQTLRQTQASAQRSTFQSMAEKQQALRDQLNSGSANAAALGQLLLDIENLRKQLTTSRNSFHDQAVTILNADQKAKLTTLENAQKLEPTIRQATGLLLLTPPENGGMNGPGGFRGFAGFGGPRGFERFGRPGSRPRN
jgi:Spy/CpxP family protein refolding chaperone